MKNLLMAIIALVMSAGISAKEKNNDKEKEAIKQVITESTNAYRARDFNRISTTFVQDESTIKTGAAKGGFMYRTGWENIGSNYKQNFTNNPDPVTRKLEKTNFKIKVYKESAWAIHDETQPLENGTSSKQIITHFLEKHDGKWKIVYMSQIFASSYDVAE
jgi:ketosteroid isomerase-like protein